MNIVQDGAGVQGDQEKFGQFAHLTTRLLEVIRKGLHEPPAEDQQAESDEDHLTGKYVFINPPVWGKTKVFYETSGNGPQEIVFLHTAGSDSRQYHGVMNDATMRSRCKMYAFDLPALGRSFPGKNHLPGNHTNTEESYVGAIRELIKVLKLNKPIVCGASMAGQYASP
jgi:pimeloyl-ACP methyl ester carboxylesterase